MSYNTPAPTGHISVAFDDLVDSTSLWALNQDTMSYAHTIFSSKIRALAPLYSGYEVKTLGDGFFHTFSSTLSALQFCLAIQKEVALTRWPQDIISFRYQMDIERNIPTHPKKGLTTRLGIHFGTPYTSAIDPTSGKMDYHGNFVNVAARIMGQADGDEIAVSDAVIMQLIDEDEGIFLDDGYMVLDRVVALELVLARLGGSQFFTVERRGRVHLKGVASAHFITIIKLNRNALP